MDYVITWRTIQEILRSAIEINNEQQLLLYGDGVLNYASPLSDAVLALQAIYSIELHEDSAKDELNAMIRNGRIRGQHGKYVLLDDRLQELSDSVDEWSLSGQNPTIVKYSCCYRELYQISHDGGTTNVGSLVMEYNSKLKELDQFINEITSLADSTD